MMEIRLNKDGVQELGNPQEIEVIADEGYNLMFIKAHVNTKICFRKIDMSKKAHPISEVINQFIRRLKCVGETKIYIKDSETDDEVIFREKGGGDMNLFSETVEILLEHGKTFNDVVAVCGKEFQITKNDFVKYSNTEYDDGYGAPQVAEDLLVIGADFWLERHEYDGSEWWEFKQMPKYKELPFKPITALTVKQARANSVSWRVGWETLAQLNDHQTEKGGGE